MKQFTDTTGETWSVEITAGTIKRVLDLLKVDLGKPLEGEPPTLVRIDTDLMFLVDLLYVVCRPEAEKRGVKDVEFADRLGREAIGAAHNALLEDLADFFQSTGRRDVAEAIRRQMAIVQKAVAEAAQLIAGDEFGQMVNSMIIAESTRLGMSAASTPPSPESPPSQERSAS